MFDAKREKFSEQAEEDYFGLFESPNVGKTLTNLSEYFLLTQGMKGEIEVSHL